MFPSNAIPSINDVRDVSLATCKHGLRIATSIIREQNFSTKNQLAGSRTRLFLWERLEWDRLFTPRFISDDGRGSFSERARMRTKAVRC